MKVKLLLVCTVVCGLLIGCASQSGYHAQSRFSIMTTGYTQYPVAEDTYIVQYRNEPGSSHELTAQFAEHRAAELGKERNYRYMELIRIIGTIYPEVEVKVKYYYSKPFQKNQKNIVDIESYLAHPQVKEFLSANKS